MPSLIPILTAVATIAGGAAAGLTIYGGLRLLVKTMKSRHWSRAVDPFIRRCSGSLLLLFPFVGAYVALPFSLQGDVLERVQLGFRVGLLGATTYFLIRVLYGAEDLITERLGLEERDNLQARTRFTQLRVLRRVLVAFLAFTAMIVVLLFVPGFRQIGAGLLASAGIAGLVIGVAAQRALGNLLAGFQIAVTQPIRLDDVVVVEGEWGRIEEITLTYVVVHIWDERRLILPISYFLEHPFTNWTHQSADILGTVYMYTDYRAPIDELRKELDRILAASTHWDGRASGLVVTDSKESTLELRALMSARDGGEAWNLRCEVREGLIRFLQQHYPEALPRVRAEIFGRDLLTPS